jgi:hypothetical protein
MTASMTGAMTGPAIAATSVSHGESRTQEFQNQTRENSQMRPLPVHDEKSIAVV